MAKCPLTPEEVGLMLSALGLGRGVHMYVASGDVYGGEETLAPLKALFPKFHSKETLASKEELEPFLPFSARMAALDFIVCDQSNVFVANNNGNMARMLAGRRLLCLAFQHFKRGSWGSLRRLNLEEADSMSTHWIASVKRPSDVDFVEHTPLPMGSSNETESEYSHGNGLDIPEIDDMISD
ncbi:hypothetical protein HU200_061211 [Digitaria exilis]|uniref:O-fucosyltransferase family protein n=1 Tax=Digitaria exilis TaxID=1010633 RepID=A0A835A854_9POAL|nr:hypothetical protein HU200_061211 [Digitaria exilis]